MVVEIGRDKPSGGLSDDRDECEICEAIPSKIDVIEMPCIDNFPPFGLY